MDITALLQALPENKDEHIYLLFEVGERTREVFRLFHSEHASLICSLYIHPQLNELQEYGPWLLEIDNKSALLRYLEMFPATVGVIIARRHLSSMAIQLSKGCVVVRGDNRASLMRFYAPHVISILALSAQSDWHPFLFRDIEQWWVPGKERWEKIFIPASTASNAGDHIVRLNEETWQQIADKPDIGSLLAQWQKMPASQHFPPCGQRDMVVKALNKAREAGIASSLEQKLYALYYLNGGKQVLESENMQVSLQQVSQGKVSLMQVLGLTNSGAGEF